MTLTWGKFELLHPGHISLLRRARRFASPLIVGINSDRSFREITGRTPVFDQLYRKYMLVNLKWVDQVVIFDDPTATALIGRLSPAHIVKGADSVLPASEQHAIVSAGAQLHLLPLLFGTHSSLHPLQHKHEPSSLPDRGDLRRLAPGTLRLGE